MATFMNPFQLKHLINGMLMHRFKLKSSPIQRGTEAPEATVVCLDGRTELKLLQEIAARSKDVPLVMMCVNYN